MVQDSQEQPIQNYRRHFRARIVVAAGCIGLLAGSSGAVEPNTQLEGYQGIWFSIGQANEWGPKYSGGLGTYTAKHRPMAIHAPAVDKTFFVYGGVDEASGDLLIMASWFDHVTCQVPRPTVVYHKQNVNDPHDDPALLIDRDGYLWIFISGRAQARTGLIYKSTSPYSTASFEQKLLREITYPQPWYIDPGTGSPVFFHMFTKYTAGRELYWSTSSDGVNWATDQKLAGFGGHYQCSAEHNGKIVTCFNYHPGGNVDLRTNLYYLQTTDRGQTWTTAAGVPVTVPLTSANNPARLVDYQSQGRNVYVKDCNFDEAGNPYLLYLTSGGYEAGPSNNPRTWHCARWTGSQWVITDITTSDHNYDMGSLYIHGQTLRVLAPTLTGPQPYGTGGEVGLWTSPDGGQSWHLAQQVTRESLYNHSYVRRPMNARDPFYAFWADGNPLQRSISRLYFCNSAGTRVYRLPARMTTDLARPERVRDFSVPTAEPLWRSRFETTLGPVAADDLAGTIVNQGGPTGQTAGQSPLVYTAYGQPGTGSPPVAAAGSFALSMPDDRSVGINTHLASDAGELQQTLTAEGFFRTPESAPITTPSNVGRRLVTQKRSATDGESRLAIGLHANAAEQANVLAVFWHDTSSGNHLERGTTVVQPDRWYHFALVYNGTSIKWYLDGHLEGTVTNPALTAAGTASVSIGNNRVSGTQDRGFYGHLDEVRVTARALAVGEFLLNAGSCPATCMQAAAEDVLWCSSFELKPGALVSGGQTETGICGAIENEHGQSGSSVGTIARTFVAYGQTGVGDRPASLVGDYAYSLPDHRSVGINTYLTSNANGLQQTLTAEGFFKTPESAPITTPSNVGRRLVTQKRSANDGESRLAVGLHANAAGQANVLAVFWHDTSSGNHLEYGTTPIQPDQWYHFALVYDGTDIRWYLDGQLEGTVANPALTDAGSATISIGNNRGTGVSDRGFFGLVDEIRIVNQALPPEAFLTVENPPVGEQEPCLPACSWPFSDADSDGDVDMEDFGTFQICCTGSDRAELFDPINCACFDRDGDDDVDLADLDEFLSCMSGPTISWTQSITPACNP